MAAFGLAMGLTACLLSFQLALDTHFVRSGKMPASTLGLAVLSAAVYLAALRELWIRGLPPAPFASGAVILLLSSLVLFHVARRSSPPRSLPVAFESAESARIVVEGPYQFVRHPFYVSYMLYWTAVVLTAPQALVAAGCLCIIGIYVALAAREERMLCASAAGTEYRAYQRRAGRFLPRMASLFTVCAARVKR